MIQFTATIKRFGAQGEKTGWTYFEVSSELVQQLKPGNRKEFKVKGKLDAHPVKRVSLLPMGGGMFIFVLNAALRKAIGKKHGAISKWIDDAKTEPTRVKRITMAVTALAKKWGYPEMIRSSQGKSI